MPRSSSGGCARQRSTPITSSRSSSRSISARPPPSATSCTARRWGTRTPIGSATTGWSWRSNLDAYRARGFVEEPDDFLPLDEIGVDEYGPHPRFNAQIWIPEGAEIALGEARFAELVDRFARLKGVEEVVHEDREVFLVRLAPGEDRDALKARVVGVVRRMKEAAAARRRWRGTGRRGRIEKVYYRRLALT